jgi:hypothetical protein
MDEQKFRCPLSKLIMAEPICNEDGTFEKEMMVN